MTSKEKSLRPGRSSGKNPDLLASTATARVAHLDASDVRIEYPDPAGGRAPVLAVEGAELTVHRGEFVCIVGPQLSRVRA